MVNRLLSLLVLAFLSTVLFLPAFQGNNSVAVAFNEHFIEGEKEIPRNANLNLNDPIEVFSYVFRALDQEVKVYPTENYYYFILKANGKEIWGNINLSVEDREKGILNFAYWEQRPESFVPEKTLSVFKRFGEKDGVSLKRISDLRYAVSYGDKEVVFNLHNLDQTPPKDFSLADGERFVQRTFDESGFGFFLIFNEKDPHFMFVLDASRVPDRLLGFLPGLVIGEKSKYAFYDDKELKRKVLTGINIENAKHNNYYDGPFDQLADNYIKNSDFKNYLGLAYPGVKGQIDNYGKFLDYENARVAITPYYIYSEPEWVFDIIKRCRESYADHKFYKCITYDQKENDF